MRRALVAIASLTLLAAAAPSRAGENEAVALPAHAWAMMFGVSGASLVQFDGGTLSLRHQVSPHASWRYGLTVRGSFRKTTDAQQVIAGVTGLPTSDDRSNTLTTGLTVTRITSLAPEAVIKPYFGLGAGFAWNENLYEYTDNYVDNSGNPSRQDYSSTHSWGPTWSGFALAGLEWLPSPRYAFHAEYSQGVSWTSLRSDADSREWFPTSTAETHRHGTDHTWTVDARGVHAGVSVFFR